MKPKIAKTRIKAQNAPVKRNYEIVLFYRWLIFLFSAAFCISGAQSETRIYAVLEALAVVAVCNIIATVYLIRNGNRNKSSILYFDVIMLIMLIFLSGGIESDLYVFLIFIIGFCGIYNEMIYTLKLGAVSAVLYALVCVLYDRIYMDGMNYVSAVMKILILLMAAIAVSRVYYEVKKYDEMCKKESRIARTDKLTGLPNRHHFDQKLREEVDFARSKGTVLNLLLFDIDNFKGFNDTYGHVSGDTLLKLFSNIIRQSVRTSDTPVRYGGEEFVIIIRELDIIIAKSVADRIRRQLEKQRIYLGHQDERQKITVSCGIAQFPLHSNDIKEVFEKADQALYHAKKIGKNIVVCYDEIDKNREMLESMSS